MGAPKGKTSIKPEDTLILYGRASLLSELDDRPANIWGEEAHQNAMAEQQDVLQNQDEQEKQVDSNQEQERTSSSVGVNL